ncbi:uncharacterized protein LOC121507951 isoform X2 [Cheilinus undulatus]|uniref:uncharacterized protein LOC121507951 isoform X2 n=1 Tax=Cheilinus undulatus TaxID=241271 RepID=UPI001BD1E458|nr:uncharacterized protein LOC121507951 isoform X2 [Cheilinus undulatus]
MSLRYLQSKSQAQLDSQILNGQSSSQTCESAHFEYQLSMSSQSEDEQEDSTAPSEESVINRTDSEKKDSTSQDMRTEDDDSTTSQPENKAVEGNKDEDYNTSLIVGDGLHFVDLASSSEFIVDEECILKLFKSCRKCNRQCRVTKRVKGLKLVVSQACCYCENRAKWTNLPDDSSGFPINGKQTIHGQISSVM